MNETVLFPAAMAEVAMFMIPIVAIVCAFAAVIAAMYLKSRATERLHRERMFLAEKGLEIPRELYQPQEKAKEKKPNDYRAGRAWLLILGTLLIFIGIGVMIALGVKEGARESVSGVTPLMIGIGFLAAERVIARLVLRSNGG